MPWAPVQWRAYAPWAARVLAIVGWMFAGAGLFALSGALAAITLALAFAWWTGAVAVGELLVGCGLLLLGALRGCLWCWDRVEKMRASG